MSSFVTKRQEVLSLLSKHGVKLQSLSNSDDKRAPPHTWTNQRNRRSFFEKFAKEKNITHPTEWGLVKRLDILEAGGGALLIHFNGSVFKALKNVYKEINWDINWFKRAPKHVWDDLQNQTNFLLKLAKKYNIKTPKDWQNITCKLIIEEGGFSLLKKQIPYRGSLLYAALRKSFPNVEWNDKWFSSPTNNLYWENLEHQKNFLRSIANRFQLETSNDWRRVTSSLLIRHGGRGFLQVYNMSLMKALSEVFPENKWDTLEMKKNGEIDLRNNLIFLFDTKE